MSTLVAPHHSRILPEHFEPFCDFVLLRPIYRQEVTEAGIVIPNTVKDDDKVAVVEAAGPWCRDLRSSESYWELSPRIPENYPHPIIFLKRGDVVRYIGTRHEEVNADDTSERLLLVRSMHIAGRISQ